MILNLGLLRMSKTTHNYDLSKVIKMSSLKEQPSKKQKYLFDLNIKMANPLKDLELTSEELKEIAVLLVKKRNIRVYKSMSEDRLLSALKESESLKQSENNFDDTKPKTNVSKARIEKIRKEFNESRCKFSKSKINEIRRNLYEKSLFGSKIKEIERNLIELE